MSESLNQAEMQARFAVEFCARNPSVKAVQTIESDRNGKVYVRIVFTEVPLEALAAHGEP